MRTESLTVTEESGLTSHFGLADGHAYHDLDDDQQRIIETLPRLWKTSSDRSYGTVEQRFADAFYDAAGQDSRIGSPNFMVCNSASQSIDVVARWLASRSFRVGLIEPTFDNLAQILRRWKIPLKAIAEQSFIDGDFSWCERSQLDAVFITMPNNPTGLTLSHNQFTTLSQSCKAANIILVIDACFRFFWRQYFDVFTVLDDANVEYMVIEDTGKTWPTQDMKASILSTSRGIYDSVRDIYSEIFLCASPFVLSILTEFAQNSRSRGMSSTLWPVVASRRDRLQRALANSILRLTSSGVEDIMPVAWVEIMKAGVVDLDIVARLRSDGIACLPGRYFFWDSDGKKGTEYVRFSLLKKSLTFDRALDVLARNLDRPA